MSRRLCAVMLLAALCAGAGYAIPACQPLENPGPPAAQSNGGPSACPYAIAVGAGVFFPTSAKVRGRFGQSWSGYGLSIVSGCRCPSCPTVGVDINFASRTSGSNYVYLLPVGVSYIYPLPVGANVLPYVGAGADLVFSDIRSIPDGVQSDIRMGAEFGLITGIVIFRNWQLQARYNFLSPLAGFDFSGLNLSVSVSFCGFKL